MGKFILRRLVILIPFLFLISIVAFLVIQLPPGNFVDTYVQNLQQQGGTINTAQRAAIEARYGLDQPLYVQYWVWIKGVAVGDLGNSFLYDRPVADILQERVPRTIGIALASILLTWIIAVPIAVYSALKKYSFLDHLFTFLSFVGLAVPAFLVALVLSYLVFENTGWLITGLFSPEFRNAPWSLAKLADLMKNLWLPLVVLALANVAGVIRILRSSLLDELPKQYVTTARSKGMSEPRLVVRYPLRIAINPLISTIGWLLPAAVGGEVVVAKVLNIPTIGPVLLDSITAQDLYLTGAIIMILSTLTVLGTLVSDVLLAVLDPRIRYQ